MSALSGQTGLSGSGSTSSARGRLPVARRDRRPALAALALLLILVGALGSALIAFRSGDRVEVLVARRDIAVGQLVTAGDLTTARVSADGGLTVDADALDNFVGTHATGSIPEGTLVNSAMFLAGDVVPEDAQVVGIVVDVTKRTTTKPVEGDVVRLIFVSGSGEQAVSGISPGETVVEAARVVDTGSGGGSDSTGLSVLVPDDLAGQVADLASSGTLAITVLRDDTEPVVDLVAE